MKKFLNKLNPFLLIIIFLFIVGCSTQNEGGLIKNKPIVSSSTSSINFSFSEDGTFFDITREGKNIKRIFVKDVPVFDTNYEGSVSHPSQDYIFNYSVSDPTGFSNPVYDGSRNKVYFYVTNQTTAGSVNANRALFSYDLTNNNFELLLKKEMSASFFDITVSPDYKYLVFSDGIHGGACENTVGLAIFDLDKNKEVDNLFLPSKQIGSITFVKWSGNSSFIYKEEILKEGVVCAEFTDADWLTTEKIYTIDR